MITAGLVGGGALLIGGTGVGVKKFYHWLTDEKIAEIFKDLLPEIQQVRKDHAAWKAEFVKLKAKIEDLANRLSYLENQKNEIALELEPLKAEAEYPTAVEAYKNISKTIKRGKALLACLTELFNERIESLESSEIGSPIEEQEIASAFQDEEKSSALP